MNAAKRSIGEKMLIEYDSALLVHIKRMVSQETDKGPAMKRTSAPAQAAALRLEHPTDPPSQERGWESLQVSLARRRETRLKGKCYTLSVWTMASKGCFQYPA